MCLHRATASCGSLYVVRILDVVAEQMTRRPGWTDAMSAPSEDAMIMLCAQLEYQWFSSLTLIPSGAKSKQSRGS